MPDQTDFGLRCEWGEEGARALGPISDVLVVVDVLSFSTCVEVATSRGGQIFPFAWKDDSAPEFAARKGAELAQPRGRGRFSLSPETFLTVTPGTRIVLPSPNGALVSLLAGGWTLLAGCLRNAEAVARHAARLGSRIAVIPAGERWPDGSLRPCFEDWVGAGAILDRLPGSASPEAGSALAAFRASRPDLQRGLLHCISGRELVARGYPRDIEIAAELNASDCVPVFRSDSYVRSG